MDSAGGSIVGGKHAFRVLVIFALVVSGAQASAGSMGTDDPAVPDCSKETALMLGPEVERVSITAGLGCSDYAVGTEAVYFIENVTHNLTINTTWTEIGPSPVIGPGQELNVFQIIVTGPDDITNIIQLTDSGEEAFRFTRGNGTYKVVLKGIEGATLVGMTFIP